MSFSGPAGCCRSEESVGHSAVFIFARGPRYACGRRSRVCGWVWMECIVSVYVGVDACVCVYVYVYVYVYVCIRMCM